MSASKQRLLHRLLLTATVVFAGSLCSCAGGIPTTCAIAECHRVLACPGEEPITCLAAMQCEERSCEDKLWTCGVVEDGTYTWVDKAIGCDDGDPCTQQDTCTGGTCVGTPLTCDDPPAKACASAEKLRVYEPVGVCQGGTCSYNSQEVLCPGGCKNDQCEGDPCAGMSCVSPPDACHETPGTCSQGTCSYTPKSGTDCGGACVDTSSDPTNCGACGNACHSTQDCSGGACACKANVGDCTSAPGCETDLLSSNEHCGGCNKACGANEVCQSAGCVCASTTEQLNGKDDDCDGKVDEGFWAVRMTVPYSALTTEHSGCTSANSGFSFNCNSASHRYCSKKGYNAGFGAVQSAGQTAYIVCLADASGQGPVNISSLTAEHPSCTGNAFEMPCVSAIKRYCQKSFAGGVGPLEQSGTSVYFTCTNHGKVLQTTWSTLQSVGNAGCTGAAVAFGPACRSATDTYCRSQGYESGFGPVETQTVDVWVFCLSKQ